MELGFIPSRAFGLTIFKLRGVIVISKISNNDSQLVLLVEDDPLSLIEQWNVFEQYAVHFVTAMSITSARMEFEKYKDQIAVIVLDFKIPLFDGGVVSYNTDSSMFLREVRATGFNKPIISASSSERIRQEMLRAGCTHEAPKTDAAALAAELVLGFEQ